jgi:hypothetical protein
MRMVVDCREVPSESHCSLTIAGEEAELLEAAVAHAVDVHGHVDAPDLRAGIRAVMRPEGGNRLLGYGTTMVATARSAVPLTDVLAAIEDWETERRVPGFVGAQLLLSDDGTIVNTAVFTDRESYERLSDDPEQDRWYRERVAPLLADEPRWIDGPWAVMFRRPAVQIPDQQPATQTTPTRAKTP